MNKLDHNLTGEAGEFFVGFTVLHELKWIYRRKPFDIGIDGEIEIVNDDGISSGKIIMVQVKSTDNSTLPNISISLEKRHVHYWKELSLPVIICVVVLSQKKVYWIPIDQDVTIPPGPEKTMSVAVKTESTLDTASKSRLAEYASSKRPFNPIGEVYEDLVNLTATLKQQTPQYWAAKDKEYLVLVHRFHGLSTTRNTIRKQFPWLGRDEKTDEVIDEITRSINFIDRNNGD